MLLLQQWIPIGIFFKVIARKWHDVCNLPFKHTYNTNTYHMFSDQLSPWAYISHTTHMAVFETPQTQQPAVKGCVLDVASSPWLCLLSASTCTSVWTVLTTVVHLRTGCCLFSLHVPDWQLCISYKNGWTSLSIVLVVIFFRCIFYDLIPLHFILQP